MGPISEPAVSVRGLTRRCGVHVAIDEETGQVTLRTLEYLEKQVLERQDDRAVRTFELHGDIIVRIDWGSAISQLQPGSSG